jgi:hypothetical protein
VGAKDLIVNSLATLPDALRDLGIDRHPARNAGTTASSSASIELLGDWVWEIEADHISILPCRGVSIVP